MRPAGSGMHMDVGIDDIAIHFPRLFFDMRDFAAFRGADYDKLNKGLGLNAMAIPDAHEDTATMGANAVARLIDRNGLDPKSIGRIYLDRIRTRWSKAYSNTSSICSNSATLGNMVMIAFETAML